jgi:hypothetical protein
MTQLARLALVPGPAEAPPTSSVKLENETKSKLYRALPGGAIQDGAPVALRLSCKHGMTLGWNELHLCWPFDLTGMASDIAME